MYRNKSSSPQPIHTLTTTTTAMENRKRDKKITLKF